MYTQNLCRFTKVIYLTLLFLNFVFFIAKFPDYKSTWSPDPIGHNPTHLSNKMWKNHISSRNTTPLPRPPPGLTNPKPSSPWSSTAPRSVRGWGTQDSRLASGDKDSPKGASLFKHKGLMLTPKKTWSLHKRGNHGCLVEERDLWSGKLQFGLGQR